MTSESGADRPGSARQPVTAHPGLGRLDLLDFRNVAMARLDCVPGLNVITGANASGKTSLLEAIHCIGRVRSFRTHRAEQMIRYGRSALRLVAQVNTPGQTAIPVGIERTPESLTVRLDGEPVRRLSDLAVCFPVQVFSADTATIFSGGPRQRRHVLDWALFHVELRYRDAWQRYARVLRQRNAALRNHLSEAEISTWDNELLESAGDIDGFRQRYLARLEPFLVDELAGLLPGSVPALRYSPGWSANTTLADALAAGLEKDRTHGYTRHGPHRADFTLLLDEHPVPAHCSRGQQKAVLLGLMLAQVRLQQSLGGYPGAFLLDDLTSELDEAHQSRVLAALRQLDAQVFVTSIEPDAVDLSAWSSPRLFHVEQGRVRQAEVL